MLSIFFFNNSIYFLKNKQGEIILSTEILHGFYFAFVSQKKEEDFHRVKNRSWINTRELSNTYMHVFLNLKILF